MSEVLEQIVSAFRRMEYEVSLHIWENYVEQPDRPAPSAIIHSIASNAPKLARDDVNNSRGAAAEIVGLSDTGRAVYSHVGYSRNPMKIITAWFTDMYTYTGI